MSNGRGSGPARQNPQSDRGRGPRAAIHRLPGPKPCLQDNDEASGVRAIARQPWTLMHSHTHRRDDLDLTLTRVIVMPLWSST